MPERHLIVFDWGGVILRICRSMHEACVRAGLHADLAEIVESAGSAHAGDFQVGRIGEPEFIERVARGSEGRVASREIAAMLDAYLIEEYDGAGSLIEEIRSRGHTTALLSNTNERHYIRRTPALAGLPHFPSVNMLDHHVASHVVGHAKPDDAIYACVEKAGRFEPARIVFFDDLLPNVEAAARRGWRAVQVDHTGDTAGQMRGALIEFGLL